MRILCLQNHPAVGPGRVETWSVSRGYELAVTRLFAGDTPPSLDTFDMLVPLGGDPSLCGRWLAHEVETIRRAAVAGKGVLGLCLGSQLIAEAMGGKLVPHIHAEVGWWPIHVNEAGRAHPLLRGVPDDLELFLFHKNTMILPPGFELLAESVGCRNQIFAIGDRVAGYQAHPEFVPSTIITLAADHTNAMPPGDFVKLSTDDARENQKFVRAWEALEATLDNIVGAIEAERKAA
jgi:GMP synthase-like glutamine amidotransferase